MVIGISVLAEKVVSSFRGIEMKN